MANVTAAYAEVAALNAELALLEQQRKVGWHALPLASKDILHTPPVRVPGQAQAQAQGREGLG